jgi:hypothetical protein
LVFKPYRPFSELDHLLPDLERDVPPLFDDPLDEDRPDLFAPEEPDPDLEAPPDFDLEADLDAEPFERLLDDDRLDPLLDEPPPEPLFDAERDPPPELLFAVERDPLPFEAEPLVPLLADVPDDFRLVERDDPPRDEPADLLLLPPEGFELEPPEDLELEVRDDPLLLPLEDLPPPDLDEPLFEVEPDRPLPPLELLLLDDEVFDDDERPDVDRPRLPPPDDVEPSLLTLPAIAVCRTFAAPSTAPIAAPATILPAASAALVSSPSLFLREPDDLFELLLFCVFVVAIRLPLFRKNSCTE